MDPHYEDMKGVIGMGEGVKSMIRIWGLEIHVILGG
jgi:hypothetical protein